MSANDEDDEGVETAEGLSVSVDVDLNVYGSSALVARFWIDTEEELCSATYDPKGYVLGQTALAQLLGIISELFTLLPGWQKQLDAVLDSVATTQTTEKL